MAPAPTRFVGGNGFANYGSATKQYGLDVGLSVTAVQAKPSP